MGSSTHFLKAVFKQHIQYLEYIEIIIYKYKKVYTMYFKNVIYSSMKNHVLLSCLFDLILYVPSTIFQYNRDGSSWVEPVLS